jgi:methylmalonyl-CoA mutase
LLVVGGVIPTQDYDFLLKNGAAMIFGPGTKVTDAAVELVELIKKNKK